MSDEETGIWDDVAVDTDLARDAADQCRATRLQVDVMADDLVRHAVLARSGWQGRQRADFDANMSYRISQLEDTSLALLRLEAAIRDGATAADHEQFQRLVARERHHRRRARLVSAS